MAGDYGSLWPDQIRGLDEPTPRAKSDFDYITVSSLNVRSGMVLNGNLRHVSGVITAATFVDGTGYELDAATGDMTIKGGSLVIEKNTSSGYWMGLVDQTEATAAISGGISFLSNEDTVRASIGMIAGSMEFVIPPGEDVGWTTSAMGGDMMHLGEGYLWLYDGAGVRYGIWDNDLGVLVKNSFGNLGGFVYAYDSSGREVMIIGANDSTDGATIIGSRIHIHGDGDSSPNDIVIYGEDSGGTDQQLFYWDESANTFYLGDEDVDTQLRGTYITGASYTPSVSNLTVGNGTWTGRRFRFGNIVVLQAQFVFGSSSAMGTEPTLNVPITGTATYAMAAGLRGTYYDATGGKYPIVGSGVSTTAIRMRCQNASATYLTDAQITATVPFAYAAGDVLAFTAIYSVA